MTVSIRSGASDGALQVNGVDAVVFNAGGVTSKIESISASIAANAITVSADTLVLDFRSETLSSGAVTTVSGTPANLVIAATDSFGLTTASGVNARIVILAINNAGTIELAASALYGGVPLGEGYAITTSATSTTATGVKSTTARTSMSFRVLGFIDATFTTAVGWSALTVIQGSGVNATANLSSLGFGQTWQVVTGSRAINTTYYNTTGKPIMVAIHTDGSVRVITIAGIAYTVSSSGGGNATNTFIVPPGASYSTDYFSIWTELR